MHPDVHKYLYYLHKSKTFERDRNAYFELENAGKVKTKALIDELRKKYEIPKHAVGDFIHLLHTTKTDPFINYELHITEEGETRDLHVKGPVLTLNLRSHLTKDQFFSLWAKVQHHQIWEIEAMNMPAKLGEQFKHKVVKNLGDFDLAFELYREKKLNPKMTFEELAVKFSKKLARTQKGGYVKGRVYAIRDLITAMKSTT